MMDMILALVFTLFGFVSALGIGGIGYIFSKRYVKNRFRRK